jgi:class 3 adenylate cyclase/TolB-like protein
MLDANSSLNSFIEEAEALILTNVENENFGVSELADAMHMSRSNLLRKIKKSTRVSASQFIRQIRLRKAMEILGETNLTISEVSFQVGFASTSYFTKCFREYYGYPPGEVGKQANIKGKKGDSSSRQRQLVAIMFTDIVGYTSLMQQDEQKAIEYRERHREVFDSTTKKYKGRILQYFGDGTLSTFPSAIDAVHCALEMQVAFTQNEPKIPIRIGIHSGDIIATNEEIIGDGVNVAARIESLAEVGTVSVSDKVYDEIKNQADFITASRGVRKLKNVSRPIEVYAVSNHVLGAIEELKTQEEANSSASTSWKWIVSSIAVIMACIALYYININKSVSTDLDKSIAVLPFKNESSDSTNAYFVNGLMESTLSKLQKINDLKVISRTTSEKYRQSQKSVPEIAEELAVNYLVEGSGQKVEEMVLLNIQLIEGVSDKPIWSEQYKRKFEDIFELQNEIAQEISIAIKAMVTPQELENIQKKPTDNLQAYDYYLQALDPYYSRTHEGLNKAIILFKKAIEQDEQFALAYAHIAISYYFLDRFQKEKQFTKEINRYSDQALLYDSKSDICLTSKALYYIENKEYRLALPHLNKAVEYNPNSALVYRMLADFYAYYEPNTKKYLLNALHGVQLDASGGDSTTVSYGYLQLSNALVQAGFFEEALEYVNLSLDYDPNNYFSPHLKIYIRFAKDNNWVRTQRLLTDLWKRDTTRLDILQDLSKIYYGQEKYDSAYYYYDKFVRVREANKLNLYIEENVKIARVYQIMGRTQKADSLFADYITYADEVQSPYRSATIAFKHAYLGEIEEAIKHLKEFSKVKNIQYWFLLMRKDPLMEPLKKHPEFETVMRDIENSFWEDHAKLKNELIEKGVL